MKTLLLNPPYFRNFSRQSRSPCVSIGGTLYYPYFLCYAGGVLERAGIDVRILDAVADGWSEERVLKYVKDFEPDLVVVDTSTPSIYNDVRIASRIKDTLPETHLNLVGTHPSRLPEETFQLSDKIDSISIGEYDYTLLDLALTLKGSGNLGNVEGLAYRNGGIRFNPPRELIKELDELPFVSEVYRKHLNIRNYFYASLLYPQVTILTARGCPYSCSFCNIPFKSSYRTRSPENVVEEFLYIQREMPEVREVMIEDDTFPISKDRTFEICDLLIERGVKLKWSCNARVNTDYETLKRMKEAGCRLLCVGFESPKQEALNSVHKGTTADLQREFMENSRKVGLLVNGCFILGMPGDTIQSMKETIEFAKELNPDTAQFYPYMVYPGTEAYEWAKRNGYLITEDYSRWLDRNGRMVTTVSRPELPADVVMRMCQKAVREFYIRRGYIAYKAAQISKDPMEALRTLKSARTFFRNI